MFSNINAIAVRINRQFLRDRRFLGLSLIVPVLLMLLLKYVLDSLPGLARLGVHISDYAILVAAYLVHFLAYVLSTIVLVRDRKDGTLGRMFVYGYRRREIVLGYVGGYSTIAAVQTALVLILTKYLFDINLAPDLIAVVLTMLALAVVSVGLGVFISNFARNEGQVFPFIPLVIVPTALLSGIAIPIDELPRVLQWCSYLIPLRYAVSVLDGVLNQHRSFFSELGPFLTLVAVGAGLLATASLTLRERE
ncbi:MAG: ABC transporter permease [Actinomycetota bacterium]|nr:ABC transporter permease [Actinomycetota bacterium]MDA8166583.1 ABC transporter permease [Actinomycetota bacterium]